MKILNLFGLCRISERDQFKVIKDEFDSLKREVKQLRAKQFRIGDKVYVDLEGFDYNTPYYLRESYNAGSCWYITKRENESYTQSLRYAVNLDEISHETPRSCKYCNQLMP